MAKKKKTPRPHTMKEMQRLLIEHLHSIKEYWINPNGLESLSEQEIEDRRRVIGGAIFSVLVTFDGGSGEIPCFSVKPTPHPSDKDYHVSRGENYYPDEVDIGGYLHELLCNYERKIENKRNKQHS